MIPPERMRALLKGFRDRSRVPAVAAAIVTPQDDPKIAVVGIRRRGHSDPATAEDKWHIGSYSKSITAALYARLVERGDAEWRAPVAAFFPDLAGQIDPAWQERTVDEVLVCQSGIRANLTMSEMMSAWKSSAPLAEQRTRAAISALSEEPGRRGRFVYSNLGYIVVGAVIDRIAGMPFEEALARHIYEPLEIASAGFGPPPDLWGHKSRLRIGDICLGRGSAIDPGETHSDNPAVMNSAGRIHLTLADWARFHRVFVTGGAGFLRPETIDHLLKAPAGQGLPMAMGWIRDQGADSGAYQMQGSNTLWSATALLHRDSERAVLVACNDGRTRVLMMSAKLAADIMSSV